MGGNAVLNNGNDPIHAVRANNVGWGYVHCHDHGTINNSNMSHKFIP